VNHIRFTASPLVYPAPFNTPLLAVGLAPEIKSFEPSLILHPKGAGFIDK